MTQSTVTNTTNRFYCGANTRVKLRQYMTRSIDQRLQGNMQFLEADLDQAVAISFAVQQSKEALYSYADSEFSAIADGKVIVMGKLITNLSDQSPSNYIAETLRSFEKQIINSKSNKSPTDETRKQAERLEAKIANGADLNPQEAGWLGSYYFTFNQNKSAPNREIQSRYNSNMVYQRGRADQHNLGFDLIIETWGNEVEQSIVLKDVSIRSIEQERSPTDQPVVEIYDFIARTVLYGVD